MVDAYLPSHYSIYVLPLTGDVYSAAQLFFSQSIQVESTKDLDIEIET